jgi:hypothetical protein
MSTRQDEAPPETTEELRADIEQTRDELAQTTQALGEKFDVKHRARSAVGSVKESVKERVTPVTESVKERVTPVTESVKERVGPATERARGLRARATEKLGRDPVPIAAGLGAVLGGLLALRWWRGRR